MKGNELLNLPDVQALLTDSLQTIIFPFLEDQQLQLLELLSGAYTTACLLLIVRMWLYTSAFLL